VKQSIGSSLREWQTKYGRRPGVNPDELLNERIAHAYHLGLTDQDTARLLQDDGVGTSLRTIRRVRTRLGLSRQNGRTKTAAVQCDAATQPASSSTCTAIDPNLAIPP
jgi:hypothetical protein